MNRVEDWQRLGREVKRARKKAGYRDTKVWAAAVGRSDRTLLGLERGERVGGDTLERIEEVLGWQAGSVYAVLRGDEVVYVGLGAGVSADRLGSHAETIMSVAEAIRQDSELLEDARQHLLRQYDLLVRLSRAERGEQGPPSPPEVRGRDLTDDEEAALRAEERERQRQRVMRRNADRDTDQGNRLGPTDNVGGAG